MSRKLLFDPYLAIHGKIMAKKGQFLVGLARVDDIGDGKICKH